MSRSASISPVRVDMESSNQSLAAAPEVRAEGMAAAAEVRTEDTFVPPLMEDLETTLEPGGAA